MRPGGAVVSKTRTHPADVTADRLIDHSAKWADKFTSQELDDLGYVVHALREIADGSR